MKLILINILITICIFAQEWETAPEIWSEPKLIQEIQDFYPYGNVKTVSVTADGNKLFFTGIAYIIKTDTGWNKPRLISNKVNYLKPHWPCISPNGNRLYYSLYRSGWFLYYSNWDSLTSSWSSPIYCGQGVHNAMEVLHCDLPDDTTIIYGREGQTYISYWDKINAAWGEGKGFPNNDNPLSMGDGIFVQKDFLKIYDDIERTDSLKNGRYYINHDISVLYKSDHNSLFYWPGKRLKFCLKADSLYDQGIFLGKYEGSPTLTGNGRTMYFIADYTGRSLVYESHMLIDENGDTVTSLNNTEFNKQNISELFTIYPNPFNSLTNVQYRIYERTYIRLSVFDILGKEIIVLDEGYKNIGEYQTILNGSNFSSGLYFLALKVNSKLLVKKVILIK